MLAAERITRIGTLVKRAGSEIGLEVNIEPTGGFAGQVVSPDGTKHYFRGTSFDINPHAASKIAKDKDYAAFFMRSMGYPVPEGRSFYSDALCKAIRSSRNILAACEYAENLGFPVFVKPNSKSQGVGVAKVYEQEGLMHVLSEIFSTDERVALVQKPVKGEDYRIVVLDNEVISAYQRRPLSIIGDGEINIGQLIFIKQQQFVESGRNRFSPYDWRISARLRRTGLDFDRVLNKGEALVLLDNANLSTGGDAVDVTEIIHPSYQELSIRLARDMGLRYCGVDLMTEDPIDQPIKDFTVLEINCSPGLDNYAMIGPLQERKVKQMYMKLLQRMVGITT